MAASGLATMKFWPRYVEVSVMRSPKRSFNSLARSLSQGVAAMVAGGLGGAACPAAGAGLGGAAGLAGGGASGFCSSAMHGISSGEDSYTYHRQEIQVKWSQMGTA